MCKGDALNILKSKVKFEVGARAAPTQAMLVVTGLPRTLSRIPALYRPIQIYLTGFRIRNPKPINLIPAVNKKPPSFRDDHYPIGFKDFVERVCRENSWIVTANSLPYTGQQSMKGIAFYVRDEGDEKRLIGTFQDKNKFGARFWLHLTDESLAALTWAADQLNQKYRQ